MNDSLWVWNHEYFLFSSALEYNDFIVQRGKLIFYIKKGKGIGEKYSKCYIKALEANGKEKGVEYQEGQRKLDNYLILAPRVRNLGLEKV